MDLTPSAECNTTVRVVGCWNKYHKKKCVSNPSPNVLTYLSPFEESAATAGTLAAALAPTLSPVGRARRPALGRTVATGSAFRFSSSCLPVASLLVLAMEEIVA